VTEPLGDRFDPDPDDDPTPRERLATLLERRLDLPMAFLALVWALFVAYELVAPPEQQGTLTTISNVIWIVFLVEFVLKLVVSGKPIRYLRRHWPSVFFLMVPALRLLRGLRALRAVRLLPAARVLGSSYRAVGTARSLLQGRLQFLLIASLVVIFGSGQLVFVLERGRTGAIASLGDALWFSANAVISGTLVYEPVTLVGRLLALLLTAYAIVVFASLAGTIGAYFVESRQERAASEEGAG
jgi:voltage-gated potassium channel